MVSLKFAPEKVRWLWNNHGMLKLRASAMMDVLDLREWYVLLLLLLKVNGLDYTRDRDLTIWLVDNEKSRALNRQYRGKDKATDVLSFPRHTVRFFFKSTHKSDFRNRTELSHTQNTELVCARSSTHSKTT
jgi:ssRNA-specific RNase YbeY (16S rRNA maturation enzyme)